MNMMILELLAVTAVTFCGGILQATTGFGIGILMITLLPPVLGSVRAVSVMGNICSIGCAVTILAHTWRKTSVKTVFTLLPMFFLMMPVGNQILLRFSNSLAEKFLGITLIAYACYNLFVREVRFRPTLGAAVISSSAAGLLSGLFSLSGPPIAVYMMNRTEDKDCYIATTHAFFLVSCLYATTVRIVSGIVTPKIWVDSLVAFAAIAAGTSLGGKLRGRINMAQMRKWIYLFILISGAIFLF